MMQSWARIGVLALALCACSAPADGSATPSPVVRASPAAGSASSPGPSPSGRTSGPSPAPAISPVAAPSPVAEVDVEGLIDNVPGGGGSNVVKVNNHADGRFEARGRVELNRVLSPDVAPLNFADAESSCTDCQSIAVAIQVNVYRSGTRSVRPQNAAVAINTRCTRCVSVARAIQYAIPVDDPHEVPRRADELARAMNRELRYFQGIHDVNQIDPVQAEARLNTVMQQFQDLLQFVSDARDEREDSDSPTPTPSPQVSPTATVGPSVTASASGTPLPAASPPATPSSTATSTGPVARPSVSPSSTARP